MTTADKVIDIAFEYLGCKQGSAKHKKLVDTFNKVKPHGETATYRDPWCAIAWTAWQILAGNTQKDVPMSYNCGEIITDAKKLGIWVEKDSTKPKKGWAILYDWDDSGKGDNTGGPDHVGLIYAVDDKWIYVIEGNKGTTSACGKRAVAISGKFIRGFVAPKYATKAYTPTTPYTGKLPTKTVKKGSKGSNVKAVQTFLNWCIKAGLKVDGECGTKTVNAIKKWQKQYKLTADGKFGSKSRAKAKAIVNAHKPKPAPTPTPSTPSTATKILNKAKALAGKSKEPTAAYKSALNKAYPNRSKWGTGARLGRSCDVYVATIVKSLGLDKDMPRGLRDQLTHKPNSKYFTRLVYNNVKPYNVSKTGDLVFYDKPNGHACVRAANGIYEANHSSKKYPHFTEGFSRLKKKRHKVVIWRPKG